ncbi:unnamed protein product [Fraxinus pennsylvanica]|uniref:Uncharacterized protein n=1 Tax=Fraxinus pennsylvanica TaxID=56036 RepID=A0AAD1ZS56_9LAMI|nr:unnamed protein product [Fraxinus pennsylvanica]
MSKKEFWKVSSDSQKRAIYDQYGEEGLKGQMPPPGVGGAGPGGMGGGSGMRSGGTRFSSSMFGDDIFSSFGEGRQMSSAPRKAPPIEQTLPCNLEELYKGTTKRMKISREIANAQAFWCKDRML